MDDQYERLTEQEKEKIVEHIMLSSPPGQLSDVFSDARELSGFLEGRYEFFQNICRKYSIINQAHVRIGGDDMMEGEEEKVAPHVLVLSHYGQVDEDSNDFYDPLISKMVTINFVLGLCKKISDAPTPITESEKVKSRRTQLQEYCYKDVQHRYYYRYDPRRGGMVTVYPDIRTKSEDLFYISISKTIVNDSYFWGGRMKSLYEVKFLDDSKVVINGEFRIFCHYFEDGNIQIKTTRKLENEPASLEDSECCKIWGIGYAVSCKITEFESSVQEGIDDFFKGYFRRSISKTWRIFEPPGRVYFDFGSAQHDLVKNYKSSRSLPNNRIETNPRRIMGMKRETWLLARSDEWNRITYLLESQNFNNSVMYISFLNRSLGRVKIFGSFIFLKKS